MQGDPVSVIELAASIASLVLALLAILLSVYFFVKGKNTETQVQNALAEIKQQTASLERIASRQLDRLTRAVTAPREDERVLLVLSAIEAHSATIAAGLSASQSTVTASTAGPPSMSPEQRRVILAVHIAAFYYSAVANVALQAVLPATLPELTDELRNLMDLTARDFGYLRESLSPHSGDLAQHQLFPLYSDAENRWRPFIVDALTYYRNREAAASSTTPPSSA